MTVEVYKPFLKARSGQSVPTHPTIIARPPSRISVDVPSRKVRHTYTPISPRMDLVIGIEELTHPDKPSFAELEALITAEDLSYKKQIITTELINQANTTEWS